MKRWALLVVGLYGLILFSLFWPVVYLAFEFPSLSKTVWTELLGAFVEPEADFHIPFWSWIAVMMLAEACLLVIPVRVGNARPVHKRHIFWMMLAAGILLLVMVGGMTAALWETLGDTDWLNTQAWPWAAFLAGVILLWAAWSALFACFSWRAEPLTAAGRLLKFLVAGSILELLVAVPTHILARHRDHCCGGFGTFWGLAAGVSVMLAAFGPGVLLLYVKRYRQVRGFPVLPVRLKDDENPPAARQETSAGPAADGD